MLPSTCWLKSEGYAGGPPRRSTRGACWCGRPGTCRSLARSRPSGVVRQTNLHIHEAVEALLAGEAATALAALDGGGGKVVEHADDALRVHRIARAFAGVSPTERARTLVLDPTRAGREQLTDAIRAKLRRDGTLGDRAMIASVLETCDLSDARRTRAASYRPASIVLFRRDDDAAGLRRDTGYRVDRVDHATNTLRLLAPDGQAVDWNLANADQVEAYPEVPQEFRTGDRIQFTRNNHPAKRVNGRTATVVAIDPDKGCWWSPPATAGARRLP